MPVALIIALAASLGIHALVLFGPDFGLGISEPESPPLLAELRPMPKRAVFDETAKKTEKKDFWKKRENSPENRSCGAFGARACRSRNFRRRGRNVDGRACA